MKSQDVLTRLNRSIGKTQYVGLYGISLASAHKNNFVDVDGHQYVDFLSGASAACLGYGREDIIQAYVTTARKLTHSCFVYSPNIEAITLAEKLSSISPGNFPKKVLLGLSASDSVDGAIKAARAYTHKKKILAFDHAYHGSTGLATQATGFGIVKDNQGTSDFHFLSYPHSIDEANICIIQAEELFMTNQIAAVIVEPIQGDGGNIIPPANFFKKLMSLTQKYKVVFIDDEAQSGMGRSGKWWAIEHFNVEPDLLIMGKALGGSYIPISACVGKREIIDSLGKAQHLFTFSGHPPSCAVASKVIDILENGHVLLQVKKKGIYFTKKLNQLCQAYKDFLHYEVRGLGLQIGLEISDLQKKSLASLFGVRLLEKGIYVGYFGIHNEVIRIHPPLTIMFPEIDVFIAALADVLKEWSTYGFPKSTYARHKNQCLGLGTTKG